MAAAAILVVEDEPAIADSLVYALKTEGFTPHWCRTGEAALTAAAGKTFDLVILDVGLPDVSGFDVCRTIREKSSVPVLFLTARNAEIDRIVGLEIGGDDYVAKPFSPREITARVRAILRRTQNGGATERTRVLVAGRLRVDLERCAASWNGRVLQLTRYEFRLLGALAARPGRVFTREQLMEQAWEDPGASLDRTVDAHVKTLRAKLRATVGREDLIRTHRGLGYSLRES